MYNRNDAVKRIVETDDPYFFDPLDGTISTNIDRFSILFPLNIADTWYPVFDENNNYIGFNAGEHGFISRDVALKEMGEQNVR
jgi:hypothetical protein